MPSLEYILRPSLIMQLSLSDYMTNVKTAVEKSNGAAIERSLEKAVLKAVGDSTKNSTVAQGKTQPKTTRRASIPIVYKLCTKQSVGLHRRTEKYLRTKGSVPQPYLESIKLREPFVRAADGFTRRPGTHTPTKIFYEFHKVILYVCSAYTIEGKLWMTLKGWKYRISTENYMSYSRPFRPSPGPF